MFTISKRFDFSASHVLEGLPEGHPCGRVHGHNYRVELVIEATPLDPYGFVIDYRALQPFSDMIDGEFDHRHLNDVLEGRQPSAELLAYTFYQRAETLFAPLIASTGIKVVEVRVSETDKTWATYRREY